MAGLPPIECPRCGEPLDVVMTNNGVVGNELLVEVTVKPCAAWCSVLGSREEDG